ncbi:5' nucleotidase, NT5C type [Ancylomarina sp. YFZ004]
MNRTSKEELKKYEEARKGLTPEQIIELDKKEALENEIMGIANHFNILLFPEEYDFYTYEKSNPWSDDYMERISRKRAKLGLSEVNHESPLRYKDTDEICESMAGKMIIEKKFSKKILYIDMDSVLVDFQSGIDQLSDATQKEYEDRLDEVPGIFSLMKPTSGALYIVEKLAEIYDIYILSTAPWENPSAWSDKLKWVHEYLPKIGHKRLILSHNKNLNAGDYLIDDRTKNGAGEFTGELIHFLTDQYPNWDSVFDYLVIEYVKHALKKS